MSKKAEQGEQKAAAEGTAQEAQPKDPAKELEEQLKQEKDRYLRLRAEFDNFRKRTELEKEEFFKFACSNIITELLPILDGLERAQGSFEKHRNETEEIIKGVALIHKQFEDSLAKLGVKKIESLGKVFDPELHEAVMQKADADKPERTIVEELQPGYMLHDKILRHAMVIVSKH